MKNLKKKPSPPKARLSKNPVVLVILDGWGIAPPGRFNAISLAKKPHFDLLEKEFGSQLICASGPCVGLTEGQMGNSEVGHLTIGAGRVIFQDLMRVFDDIRSGKLEKNPTLLNSLRRVKRRGGTLHFLGLLSDGGVHSHIDHLFALLRIAKKLGVQKVGVHAFLDGRDTPPRSGVDHLAALSSFLKDFENAMISTIGGRYYAMDRDNRWERTKLAYDAIVYGEGEKFEDPISAVKESYLRGENDEFIIPIVDKNYAGMKDGDLVIFFNFRPDRARQLTKALSANVKNFGNLFDRSEPKRPKNVDIVTMTIYDPKLKGPKALLGRERVSHTLSNVLENKNFRQLRIAETEKYAHVTYFFNGLAEKPKRFEDRILIPSQKVETYDKSPEMSAGEITREALTAMATGKYSFILINFANSDMVGHSGMVAPTVKAVEIVDGCLGQLVEAWRGNADDLTMIVTADHGNAEKMFDSNTGQPHTAHTANPVPLVIVSKTLKASGAENYKAGLRDIAPTILKIMEIPAPKVMTGKSLV